MVRIVLRVANEPARRFRLLWYLVAWGCAGVFLGIGATYAVGANDKIASPTLHLLITVEQSLHIHGWLMAAIGVFLVYGLSDYRRVTRAALLVMFLYSLWVASMILLQHLVGPASWAGPFWYLFIAFLTAVLIVLAPPLNPDGRRFAGSDRV